MPAKLQSVPDLTQLSYLQYQQQYPGNPMSKATYQRYRAQQKQEAINALVSSQAQDISTIDTRSISQAQKEISKTGVINDVDKHCILSRSIECLKVAVLTQPTAAQWALERLSPEVFAKKEHATVTANNIGIKLVFGGKKKPKNIEAQVL